MNTKTPLLLLLLLHATPLALSLSRHVTRPAWHTWRVWLTRPSSHPSALSLPSSNSLALRRHVPQSTRPASHSCLALRPVLGNVGHARRQIHTRILRRTDIHIPAREGEETEELLSGPRPSESKETTDAVLVNSTSSIMSSNEYSSSCQPVCAFACVRARVGGYVCVR